MPVKTPDIEMPVYKQEAEQATPPMAQGTPQPQQLPTAAGYVSKGGAAAYVANGIIDGWLKGRQIAAVKNMQTAQNELKTSLQSYKNDAEKYQQLALTPGADPKKLQEARETAVHSWNAYNRTREHYMIPEGDKGKGKDGKSKGVGGKVKQGLANFGGQMFGKSGITPHLVAEAAVKSAYNNPEGLDPTIEQKMQIELGQQQLESGKLSNDRTKAEMPGVVAESDERVAEHKLKQENRAKDAEFTRLSGLPNPTLTERSRLDQLQREVDAEIGKTDPQKLLLNSAVRALQAQHQPGAQPLTPDQRSVLRANNLLPKLHVESTQQGNKELKQLMDDEGNVVRNLPSGWTVDQTAAAEALADHNTNKMYDHIAMAMGVPLTTDNKGRQVRTDQRVWKGVLEETGRNHQWLDQIFLNDPMALAKRKEKLQDALLTIWRNSSPKEQEIMSNFVSGEPAKAGGRHAFLDWQPELSPQGKTWFGLGSANKYKGGLKEEDVASQRAALWNRTRQALIAQGMTPMEADLAAPTWAQQQPIPGQANSGQPEAAPAGESAAAQPGSIPPPPESVGQRIWDGAKWLPGIAVGRLAGNVIGAEYDFAKSAMTQPPRDMTKSGKNNAYGEQTPKTKVYLVFHDNKWNRYNLEPEDVQNLKDAGQQVKEPEAN